MFDFLDNDWFIITLEIIFLLLIINDVRQYRNTKKKEHIFNILLTVGFAIWVLYPMCIKYFGWEETQKNELMSMCRNEDIEASKLCECINNTIVKTYTYNEYIVIDKNSSKYQAFMKDTKEECLDDSWF